METNRKLNKNDEDALRLAVFKRDYAALRDFMDPALWPIFDKEVAELIREAEAEHACAKERVP